MSKVTYLLGAGASAGQLDNSQNRLRGLPTIKDFGKECIRCMNWIEGQTQDHTIRTRLHSEMNWLLNKCKEYPTIDTYARILFATQQWQEYERLKRVLSMFMTLLQIQYPRDLRYDGWIASLVDDYGAFPANMNILTWNYDAQFELAYSSYWPNKSTEELWSYMSVLNKSRIVAGVKHDGFSVTKLNGTAFHHIDDAQLLDILLGIGKSMWESYLPAMYLDPPASNITNELSYVWEVGRGPKNFNELLKQRVQDTEVLVVIGYSFPYVNRSMDKFIFSSMPKLSKIYNQNGEAEVMDDLIRGRLGVKPIGSAPIDIIHITNTSQFCIPNELD